MPGEEQPLPSWPAFALPEERGCFFALDGLDGSGQSTQARRLFSWLRRRNLPAHLTREPSGGPAGLLLRLALEGRLAAPAPGAPLDELSLALLFAADRADHLACEVLPLLRRGVNVVTDRYLLSSFAYQGVHLDAAWLETLHRFFPRPDLTVFLDVPPAECLRRIAASRWRLDKNEHPDELERVHEQMHAAARRMQAAGARVALVDGTREPDAVHAEIVALASTTGRLRTA